MIQITPQMRVLVAIEPVDGRKGIDSLARLCQEKLCEDPFSGCVFSKSPGPRLTCAAACVMDWKWSGGDGTAQVRFRPGGPEASVDDEGGPEEQPDHEGQCRSIPPA